MSGLQHSIRTAADNKPVAHLFANSDCRLRVAVVHRDVNSSGVAKFAVAFYISLRNGRFVNIDSRIPESVGIKYRDIDLDQVAIL